MNIVPSFELTKNYDLQYPKQKFVLGGTQAILQEDFSLIINDSDDFNFKITVKKNFMYDGFSVPWLFEWVQSPFTGAVPAALMHDAVYATNFLTRSDADWLFLVILQMYGENWLHRNLLYSAVKTFGWTVYGKSEYEKAKNRRYVDIDYYYRER